MAERSDLRIGLQVNTAQRRFSWPEIRVLAVAAEEAGFDSVWTEDHLLSLYAVGWRSPWEAFSILGALAAATRSVRIGTMVAATVFRNPALLAKQAAAVDEISDGRLVLGLGSGYYEGELTAFGYPTDHLVSRFEEAFTIVRRMLAGETVTLEGTYHTVREAFIDPPGRPGGPELMVGADGPRMLRITLPHVSGWNTSFGSTAFDNRADKFADLCARVDEACQAVGRDPAEVWRSAQLYVRAPGAEGLPINPLPERIRPVSGDADALAEQFSAFRDAGGNLLILLLDPPTEEAIETVGRAIEQLGG